MSDFMRAAATQSMGTKTVIEILSDDSDDSDVDMDSQGGGELETTEIDKKPTNLSSASSNGSGPSSPPTTASAQSPNDRESQRPTSPRYPQSASQTLVADDSSADEDLRHVLQAARKARTRNTSSEQTHVESAPVSAPAVSSAPLLSDIQAALGGHIKSTYTFFRSKQTQTSRPQVKAALRDSTPGDTHTAGKRKTLHDPFAEYVLNIPAEDARPRKRRRHDKARDPARRSANSQTPRGNAPHHQVPSQGSSNMVSHDPKDQSVGAPGFEQAAVADVTSRRCQSLVSNLTIRSRAKSVDPMGMSPKKHRSKVKQRFASGDKDTPTVLPAPDHRQTSRTADEAGLPERVVINIDEDVDSVQLPGTDQITDASATQPAGPTTRRNTNEVTAPGLPSTTRHQRSSETQHLSRNESTGVSPAPSDDLRGYIGGHPKKRPVYAQKVASRWDRMLKNDKSRQGAPNHSGKRTAVDKHRSQQSMLPSNPGTEARLLRAQEVSHWRQASVSSTRKAVGTSKPTASGFQSQRVAISEPHLLFRPNKNAYHPLPTENEDDDEEEDAAAPERYSSTLSGPQTRRIFRPQIRLLPRSNRSFATQSPHNDDDEASTGLQKVPAATNSPNTPRQAQHLALPVPQGISTSSRPRGPRQQRPNLTPEDLKRAEADMMALGKGYEEKPRTMVVDKLPLGFGESEPLQVRRAKESLAKGRAEIYRNPTLAEEQKLEKRISKRRAAIRREVQKRFGQQSQDIQDDEFEKRFAPYLKKQKLEVLQAEESAYVPSAVFDAAFLENGCNDDEAHDGQGVDLNRRRIPAYEALATLGSNVSIDKFTVLLSKPHGGDQAPNFVATKAFGQLEPANHYALMILYDLTPPNAYLQKSQKKKQVFTDVMSGYKDGFFWGQGTLSSGENQGKRRTILVHKEEQMVGDLTPGALRNKFVDEELLKKYARVVYDAVMIKTVPKCFDEAEEEDKKKLALRKQQQKREQEINKLAEGPAEQEGEVPTGLEGKELRQGLAKLKKPGSSHANENEEVADDQEHPSDTASQASGDINSSKRTLRATSPPGDSYERTPRNPYADVGHNFIFLGTFTTLREANKTVLSAAQAEWRPRNLDCGAIQFWNKKIVPYLADEDEDVDEEALHLVFPKFDKDGPFGGHRPWGFTHSQVVVIKRDLQGPLDLAIDYVQESHEVYKATSFDRVIKKVEQKEAQAAAGVEAAGSEEHDPEVVELLDEESPDRESSDEEDVSEEE